MQSSSPALATGRGLKHGSTGYSSFRGSPVMVALEPGHPSRGGLESFIARRYEAIFGTHPGEFPPLLLGRCNQAGD